MRSARPPVREPSRSSASAAALADAISASVPRALLLSVVARVSAFAVDVAALLVLAPLAFASYLAVLLVVDLLLAFFAVAPRLAAVRVLARATLTGASLDAVRLTVAVRSLWRRLERRVVLAGLVVAGVLVVFAGAGFAALAGLAVALVLFALRGRLEIAAGLLAGLLRPLAALTVSALLPPLVVLPALVVLLVADVAATPAVVLGVHAAGVAVALLVARFVLVAAAPAAAVAADVADAPPVPFSALLAWTGASLVDRAIGVLPLLSVLVAAAPVEALAYAMAWRVAFVLDAGPLVHAVVRPAVAAVTGSPGGSVAASDARSRLPELARGAVSAALWWTLVFALLVAGPLVALDAHLAAVFAVDARLFGSLLRLFVLARLLVVPIGPGAEVLESSGHHARRLRIALRVGAPATLAPAVSSSPARSIRQRVSSRVPRSWSSCSKRSTRGVVSGSPAASCPSCVRARLGLGSLRDAAAPFRASGRGGQAA